MEESKSMKTPMHTSCVLAKDENGKKVDQTVYKGMIRSLLYLTTSRPNIMFSVCIYAKFQSDPKESHLTAVKRIFKYLVGTTNLSLVYKHTDNYRLTGYCDADYARNRIERKSTSGGCHFIGRNLISWASKKQNSIALSLVKANYISTASCFSQLLWVNIN